MLNDIARLLNAAAWPAATVVVPTERTGDNDEARIKTRNLIDEAEGRLEEEAPDDGPQVAAQLRELAGRIDWAHTLDGIALFSCPGIAETHPLRERPAPSAAVDARFHVRDLIETARHTSCWVVVLSTDPARLYLYEEEQVIERNVGGFPLTFAGEVAGRQDRSAGSRQRDDRYQQFFRQVDRALRLALADDDLPVVTVGVERHLAFFAEVATTADRVVGSVVGNVDRLRDAELAQLVEPAVAAHRRTALAAALAALDGAVGQGRATAGLADTWTATAEGRLAHLLIERGYREPATSHDDEWRIEPASPSDDGNDSGGEAWLDDAPAALIGEVLLRGGDVTVVDDGQLSDVGRIGGITRW